MHCGMSMARQRTRIAPDDQGHSVFGIGLVRVAAPVAGCIPDAFDAESGAPTALDPRARLRVRVRAANTRLPFYLKIWFETPKFSVGSSRIIVTSDLIRMVCRINRSSRRLF